MSRVGAATVETPATQGEVEPSAPREYSRRRFTIAAVVGLGIALVPYLWVLWDGRLDPLRTARPDGLFSDFYDVQARALFDGHWDVPKGSLTIEAFVVGGKDFMYFGPFSSLLRMPVLAVTDVFDGRLTAVSMLLAWLVMALFSALLVWRVRLLVRGPVALGRGEAVSYAVFLAVILSGSVLLYLATMPWVFHEDFAWGAALGVGALFAVLGVLERPSTAGVLAAGALTLAATLSRTTIGWGCVIAVLLAAAWFALGRGGGEHRRWWVPLLAAGMVPFAIGIAINWVKFGIPFGLPMESQVFTRISAHRREVLAENGGRYWSPRFVPSALWAYLRPDGLRLTPVFPFITLPATPAPSLGGVLHDHRYRTGSMTASMPLLFLLGVWGMVTAFRPRPVGRVRLTRILLVAATTATAGVLVWGYIAERYLAEFIPLLVVAGAVGLVDVWRRLDGRGRTVRRGALAAITALGLFGIFGNLLIARAPTDPFAWEGNRIQDYIKRQQSISDLTGYPLDDNVVRGTRLPRSAPADQLFVVGDCDALYISTGEHDNPWIQVESNAIALDVAFQEELPKFRRSPLVTIGTNPASTVSAESDGTGRFRLVVDDPYDYPNLFSGRSPQPTNWRYVQPGRTYRLVVSVYKTTNRFTVTQDGREVFNALTLAQQKNVVPWLRSARPGQPALALTVVSAEAPQPVLCRTLLHPERG
jgi:hypothetical protein